LSWNGNFKYVGGGINTVKEFYMIYLLDRENDTVGYLDGDDCKDLDNNILGHIKRDDNDKDLHYILSKDLRIMGQLRGNEFKGRDGELEGWVTGNDVIMKLNNTLLGHIKIDDIQDAKNVARAGAV
jgi:hypothetical protein